MDSDFFIVSNIGGVGGSGFSGFRKEIFVLTSETNTIVLSNPVSNINLITIFIDGVLNNFGYQIFGNSIIFDNLLPKNSEIVVIY